MSRITHPFVLLVALFLAQLGISPVHAQPAPNFKTAKEIEAALSKTASAPSASQSSNADRDADLLRAAIGGANETSDRAIRDLARPAPDGRCKPTGHPMPGAAALPAEVSRHRNLAVVPLGSEQQPSVDLALHFDFASYALAPGDRRQLDELVLALKGPLMATARVTIAGHTDAQGSRDLNLRLSCGRGLAVLDYLLAHGIAPERLGVFGFGSAQALGSNDAKNRRVEIRRAD